MSSGFVYLRPVYVMFVRAHGAYASSSPEAWRKVIKWIDEARMRHQVTVGYGLMHDNPHSVPAEKCRYDACIEIPEDYEAKIPGTFSVQKLPGGAFARRRHKGLVSQVSETIVEMRDKWLPESGLWLDSARPILEIYHDYPDIVEDGKRKIDICVPVSPEGNTGDTRSAA